ncbi:MAG: cytochrome d ubiquinol oxidase subunit II [Lautropia sp.]|nr:cytochrome d ubiquinol oxidase subunit II [Lautropia sp.]
MILHELISYDVLRVIWWLLMGLMLMGFASTGGFDLGVGTLLPFVARTDVERRVVLNTQGPIWEGNQVWLIAGGGCIFAAWPQLYAVSFSGFYLAMFAILVPLILRPVGFKYRSKIDTPRWRTTWDGCLFIGGFVPALIFGVAIGNVLQGVPFRLAPDMRIYYDGTFTELLNPFALLCGLVSVAMLVTHGAAWLQLKTEGDIQARSRRIGLGSALLTPVLYVLAGAMMWWFIDGYRITGEVVTTGPSNPMMKTAEGGVARMWFANYEATPELWLVPLSGILGPLLAAWGFARRKEVFTLLANGVGVCAIIGSVGVSMFPFILPSSAQPRASLTVWDSSSSHLILFVMLFCSVIMLPIILAYTGWVYSVIRGKVTCAEIEEERGHAY